jgi:hypothetical protein
MRRQNLTLTGIHNIPQLPLKHAESTLTSRINTIYKLIALAHRHTSKYKCVHVHHRKEIKLFLHELFRIIHEIL